MNEDRLLELMIHVVAPVGSAMWAFTQLAHEPRPAVAIVLASIVIVGIAYGFNRTIAMADRRLNADLPSNGGDSA